MTSAQENRQFRDWPTNAAPYRVGDDAKGNPVYLCIGGTSDICRDYHNGAEYLAARIKSNNKLSPEQWGQMNWLLRKYHSAWREVPRWEPRIRAYRDVIRDCLEGGGW